MKVNKQEWNGMNVGWFARYKKNYGTFIYELHNDVVKNATDPQHLNQGLGQYKIEKCKDEDNRIYLRLD